MMNRSHSDFEGMTFEPSGLISMQRTKSGGVSLLLHSEQGPELHSQFDVPPSEHGIVLLFSSPRKAQDFLDSLRLVLPPRDAPDPPEHWFE